MVSDEALALLVIENGSKLWDDIWSKSSGKVRPIRIDETYPEEWKSTVFPEHTQTSKADPAIDKHTKDKHWTQAGIARFNVLRQAIISNHQAYAGFKVRWLRQACKEKRGQVDQDVDDVDEDKVVDADDDLFHLIASS
jgi:hypothetical protein